MISANEPNAYEPVSMLTQRCPAAAPKRHALGLWRSQVPGRLKISVSRSYRSSSTFVLILVLKLTKHASDV